MKRSSRKKTKLCGFLYSPFNARPGCVSWLLGYYNPGVSSATWLSVKRTLVFLAYFFLLSSPRSIFTWLNLSNLTPKKNGCLLSTNFVLLFYVSFLCRFLLSMVNPPTWSLPVWARNLRCGTTLSWSSVLLRTTVSSFTTGTEATPMGTLWLSF